MVSVAWFLQCLWFVCHSGSSAAQYATEDACDEAIDASSVRYPPLAKDAHATLHGGDSIHCSQSFMQLAVGSAIAAKAIPTSAAHLPPTPTISQQDAALDTAKAIALAHRVFYHVVSRMHREFAKHGTPLLAVSLILTIGVIGGMTIACGLMLIFRENANRAVLERETNVKDSSAPDATAAQTRSLRTTGTGSPASVTEYEELRCPKLCHGLVVPLGSECVLAVRPANLNYGKPCAHNVEAFDMNGRPVLGLDLKRPLVWAEAMEEPSPKVVKPAVTLRMLGKFDNSTAHHQSAANGQGFVLASCREAKNADGQGCMYVYNAQDKVFACLAKDPEKQQRYLLWSVDGDFEIIFDGIFRDYAVLIYNKRQEQLACAEPCRVSFNLQDQFYKLQINAGVDVGLIICCLVALDEMEASLHGTT